MSENESPIRWIRITCCPDALNARIVAGLLESEDMPVLVFDEHFVTANWFQSLALGGVKLYVPAEHAERASELIRQHAAGELDLDDFESPTCTQCGQHRWERYTRGRRVSMVLLLFLSLPVPFLPDRWRCANCGSGSSAA